jgi:predicted DNA-binding ArsR family transcriptional regulator
MSLEKLQQEAEELKSLDVTKLSPEQLNELVKKLELMMNEGETLLSTLKIEDNEPDNS